MKILFVGLQPTVNASRAPHLLPEQSVLTLRFNESWTCVARQRYYELRRNAVVGACQPADLPLMRPIFTFDTIIRYH